MSQKYFVTRHQDAIVTALYEDDKVIELDCEPESGQSILGNIYVGRVRDIVKNINAAFVEIQKNVLCYYSLTENTNHIFTKKASGSKLLQGDEIIVQISKEPVKTKPATCSSHINLTGKYAALVADNGRSGVSTKISEPQRGHLKKLAASFETEAYSFVVRTNAKSATDEQICEELLRLKEQYEQLVCIGSHRTLYSVLHRQEPLYIQKLQALYTDKITDIITDVPEYYEEMQTAIQNSQQELQNCLQFYSDNGYSLWNLHSLEKQFKEALGKKVWMKSGAYLIVEHTEAMHVIDVNTGKFTGKRNSEDTYLKINLEAAREVARQIRLRNLSGMILVDFIDMKQSDNTEQLVRTLSTELKKDPISTSFIDITKLGIVEITRKKTRKPLYETAGSLSLLPLKGQNGE